MMLRLSSICVVSLGGPNMDVADVRSEIGLVGNVSVIGKDCLSVFFSLVHLFLYFISCELHGYYLVWHLSRWTNYMSKSDILVTS